MRSSSRNPKSAMSNKNIPSSSAQASISCVDKVSSYVLTFKKNIAECQHINDRIIKDLNELSTECKNLTTMVKTLTEKLINLESEKCNLEQKMTIELQARDEKIKSQTEEIKTKYSQLNALKNGYDKLKNEKDTLVQRLTNHFAVIMKEIVPNVPGKSLNNHGSEPGMDVSTLPTTTNNVNKRTKFDELFEEHKDQAKRLRLGDSAPSEKLPSPNEEYEINNDFNRPVLDNSITSDSSIETTEAQKELIDGADIECSTSETNSIDPQFLNPIKDTKRNCRKNIRRVTDFEDLAPETRSAYQREKERKTRYVRKLQTYNETYGLLPGEVNKFCKLVLDFDPHTMNEVLTVDDKLSRLLKPHQVEGVKFMFDACFESLKASKNSNGGGCILAHCMGLGKTLQVITLIHTLLSNQSQTNVKKVLIICPVNVIYNWKNEFEIWLKDCNQNKDIVIHELFTCRPHNRGSRMGVWHREGGVLLIGYDMFRRFYEGVLAMDNTIMEKKEKKMLKIFQESVINPGADLVVCDEGHLLKNPNSRLSKAVNGIRTLRRIVLTGIPLQNNLGEYFCMVEFVKPKLLGTENEFKNRFKNPIENGQYSDSKKEDILLMQRRSHILHKLLDGCVQRRDYSVLAELLPPKQEFVIFIRLTDVQITLYKFYMTTLQTSNPIGDFSKLRKICNHPKVLVDFNNRRKQKLQEIQNRKRENQHDHEQEHESENDSESDSENSDVLTTTLPSNGIDKHEWWSSLCNENQLKLIESSGKMLALFTIIKDCEALGDKLLVFSCCLSTLNVIEQFLHELDKRKDSKSLGFKGSWTRDIDYFRIDDAKSIEDRNRDISNFNSKDNLRARLFLLSTKAGGVGINLMAANRVVIFDASWNPSHDIQSIFRTYRIGQTKECFVYRFISLGTMEEKIYDRQITKLRRVKDKQQIGRHYEENDLRELYSVHNLKPPIVRPNLFPYREHILNDLLQRHSDIIYNYMDHDSLLEDNIEERLSQADRDDAWGDFTNKF